MISITRDDFDAGEMIEKAKRSSMGALVTFVGTVRDDDIERMELEAYEEVAVQELTAIRNEAMEKYPVQSVDIIHRIGSLRVGENILLIIVGAGHRKEAFDACEYVLERIKESVPIWKKEIGEGGERWVPGEHPEGGA
ncbi:molybdopterin biosynthesis protein MoeE [Methanoculleus taiwanensis]|uniref:Molybdopterin biosynthesis protein MoeE n=1 Tax=Methanoculleus taiwanensis TaxID=1550565 RepID=A0A498H2X9_9EURY|nr:molybdenum cofactor biosynthesis protein MoaE [Methanoculleus taiwanensis]RXE57451.1 molybdopterin biosynthesis protein MoeE [Methanoculleus taiwanensis]